MKTYHVSEKLALWVGGDLSEQEMASVQAHLDVCDKCRSEALNYKEAMSWLQAPAEIRFTQEECADIRNSVMAKIRSDKQTKKSHIKPFIPLLIAAAASIPVYLLFSNSVMGKSELPTAAASAKPDSPITDIVSGGTDATPQANETQTTFASAVTALARPSTSRYARRAAKDQPIQPLNYWPDPSITRIEIQTEDPSIKIILVPPSTTTDLIGDTHEQPS